MKILGISGFENSIAFKKAHWPGLEEREYRISQGHDAAAALVIDGVPMAAAAEERFISTKLRTVSTMGPIKGHFRSIPRQPICTTRCFQEKRCWP